MHQVGIDRFFQALKSLNVNKSKIGGEPLKVKYSKVAPYGTHKSYLTPGTYEQKNQTKQ